MDEEDALEKEIAEARVVLADAILRTENYDEILIALNHLFLSQVEGVVQTHASGKKSEARRKKRVADEIFTIMMCTVYRGIDRRNR